MMLDDGVHDEELRQAARRLGAAAAERVDVERTAEAVLARLRAGDAPARSRIRWIQPAWLRAAAVVVLMIGVGTLLVHRFNPPTVSDRRAARAAGGEIGDMSSGQLQTVLAALDEPAEMPAVHAAEAGLEDLTESQLQSLLRTMEE